MEPTIIWLILGLRNITAVHCQEYILLLAVQEPGHQREEVLWRERMGVEPTEDVISAPQRI